MYGDARLRCCVGSKYKFRGKILCVVIQTMPESVLLLGQLRSQTELVRGMKLCSREVVGDTIEDATLESFPEDTGQDSGPD
ncbi:hypothetical protein RRG08_060114 [Elysia crispata]|uniref:Uncharacterized protein n=1 Tax=Elysia crispata TaxID=231223 RepID=A0AAE1BDA4_9GAST|nr:hypothetical protein RRG08_060114 [Elysia crispata]